MPSKLGVHIVQGARTGFGDYLRGAHAAGTPVPLVKSIDDYAPLQEAKEINPKTVTIFRTFKLGDTPPGNFTGVPEAVAAAWMEDQMRHWQLGGADYFEPINEPAPASLDGYRWLNDFSLACMRIAEHNGFRLCLYNFAGGVPGDDPPGHPGGASAVDKFRALLPSLRHALDNNHALGLHGYGLAGSGSLKESAQSSALHYRAFYKNVLEPAGLGKLKLFITEAAPFGGHEWDRQGKEAFLDDVFWYDREVRKDPYLIGVALYTLGDWAKANFQDALSDITQHFGTVAGADDPRYEEIVAVESLAAVSALKRREAQSDWEFIADITIPDGSRFPPGAPLEKVWRVRNTGSTTWDDRFQLRFASGEQMGGPDAIPLGKTSPGQELDIKVNLAAPIRPDRYASYWKLYDANGVPFGTTVWLDIVVAPALSGSSDNMIIST